MDTLLGKLDTLFLKEEKVLSMSDYIIDFEQWYCRMRKYKMELPDAVFAFKLLDTACNMNACMDLTFTSMKSVLKRIFGSSMGVNQENAYITEQRRQRAISGPQKDHHKTLLPGTNPLDRSKCAVCQFPFTGPRTVYTEVSRLN